MIDVLDNNKNVGFILMFTGFVLFCIAIYCLFTEQDSVMVASAIGDLIMGEVIFFTGIGIYRGKSVNHFLHVFDDCETRTGMLCCMSAGFGLAFLIDGILSVVSNDSVNAVGNIVSGLALLIGSWVITEHKDTTVARVSHTIMCVFSLMLILILIISVFTYALSVDIPHVLAVMMNIITLFIVIAYALDSEVSAEIWGKPIHIFGSRRKD